MEFKSGIPNNNLEKQNLWDKWVAKVDKITDGLNYPIDPGIKESVVAFNVLGFKTTGSCEGHASGDKNGHAYPWINIEVISDDIAKVLHKDLDSAASKAYKDKESFIKGDPELYSRLEKTILEHKEKEEKLEKELRFLLDEFYQFHIPFSLEGKIGIHGIGWEELRIEVDSGRSSPELDMAFEDKIFKLTQLEKEEFLKNNQAEMKAFTEFLKKKFFENK